MKERKANRVILYAGNPRQNEFLIGEGRNGTIESIAGKQVYAWVEKGKVVVWQSEHNKINLGEGAGPVLKSINLNEMACLWKKDGEIFCSVITM